MAYCGRFPIRASGWISRRGKWSGQLQVQGGPKARSVRPTLPWLPTYSRRPDHPKTSGARPAGRLPTGRAGRHSTSTASTEDGKSRCCRLCDLIVSKPLYVIANEASATTIAIRKAIPSSQAVEASVSRPSDSPHGSRCNRWAARMPEAAQLVRRASSPCEGHKTVDPAVVASLLRPRCDVIAGAWEAGAFAEIWTL